MSSIARVCIGLLYVGLFFPVFRRMAGQWYEDPNYSHGFLVPLVTLYLTWELRGELRDLPRRPSPWGAAALGGGLVLLLLGTIGAELFLQNLSTVIVLAALVWLLLGWEHLRRLSFPLGFLVFYVPVPALILNQIAFPLQLLAARSAVGVLGACGVPVLREGNIIVLAATTLEVAEACSGIRSLQALVALSVVFAYVAQRTLVRRAVLILLAAPTAVFANVVRVSGTGLIAHHHGVEMAEGFYHGFTSWLVFVLAFAVLATTSFLMNRLPHRGASGAPTPPDGSRP